MRFLTSKYIHNGHQFLTSDQVLVVNTSGSILDILPLNAVDLAQIEHFNGLLCPGFVNTHCHLELSHMRGMLAEKTGLIPFIKGVLAHREAPMDVIQEAIRQCDLEMFNNGIVAVGDISNTNDTFQTKTISKIHYHTFVEIFNLDPKEANATFKTGIDLMHELDELSIPGSLAPHAPYTVSKELLWLINEYNRKYLNISSLHNQETKAENDFFLNKTGLLNDFYNDWGFDISFFQPTGKKSLQSTLPYLPDVEKMLLVHNTMSTVDDIQFANSIGPKIYWNTNPNANLYIENQLPQYDYFVDNQAKMTIGTDSIASNWQLSILEEIKTIQRNFSTIPIASLLNWGTQNGAEFMGIDNHFGSLEKGKMPGILNITGFDSDNGCFTDDAKVNRVV